MTKIITGQLYLFITAFFLSLSLLLPGQAHAQRVTPMSYELAPSGTNSTVNLSLENTSQTDMTIEMTANRIAIDDKGLETTTPAEDDFLIFPPQMILKAGKKQTVRVKYVGEPTISESVAYRIGVEQVPVTIDREDATAVGLVVNFKTLAHVAPKGAKTNIKVDGLRANAAGGWDVQLTNSGKRLVRLSKTNWTFSGGGQEKAYARGDVSSLVKANIILPGQTVTLSMPAVPGMSPSATTLNISEDS